MCKYKDRSSLLVMVGYDPIRDQSLLSLVKIVYLRKGTGEPWHTLREELIKALFK